MHDEQGSVSEIHSSTVYTLHVLSLHSQDSNIMAVYIIIYIIGCILSRFCIPAAHTHIQPFNEGAAIYNNI